MAARAQMEEVKIQEFNFEKMESTTIYPIFEVTFKTASYDEK